MKERINKFLTFRRITTSGSFIAEIDGLRFVTTTIIVLFHIAGFILLKTKDMQLYGDSSSFNEMLLHMRFSVELFFVISGFILGLPFAKHHLEGKKAVDIKNYFTRRLTRIEPPYIIVMTVLLFAVVYVVKNLGFAEALKSYLCSVFYIHNIVYGKGVLPLLNGVAWSLEIEVQFYIIAPLLAFMFSVKNAVRRRLLFCAAIIFCLFIGERLPLNFLSVINFLEYFLTGFLLADFYVSKDELIPKTKFDHIPGLLAFLAMWAIDKVFLKSNHEIFLWETFQLLCVFVFYYYVLINKTFSFLANNIVTSIGGMCYSIYLLHFVIISLVGKPLFKYIHIPNIYLLSIFFTVVLLIFILLISSAFFLIIEKPCMDKDWYKKFLRKADLSENHL